MLKFQQMQVPDDSASFDVDRYTTDTTAPKTAGALNTLQKKLQAVEFEAHALVLIFYPLKRDFDANRTFRTPNLFFH